jgi:hypothetical protein
VLRIAPRIEVKSDCIRGSTALAAQCLVLFAYCRAVTIDRARRQVVVTTRQFWFWERKRRVPFDCVARIIYRAQGVPSFSPLRYVTLQGSTLGESAFFFISLAIKQTAEDKRANEELALFSVWEQQPREADWLDRIAGVRINTNRIGDETAGAIVDLVREYLAVPISTH